MFGSNFDNWSCLFVLSLLFHYKRVTRSLADCIIRFSGSLKAVCLAGETVNAIINCRPTRTMVRHSGNQ
jgi:hypothetical protein